MKNLVRFVLLITTLFASVTVLSAAHFKAEDRRAVEISIGGIGNGIDAGAYGKLRKVIGDAVTNSIVDKWVVYGYGSEGGFSGCIEDRPATVLPSKAFENTVKQLNNIHPKSGTTYSVQRIKSCLALPAVIKKPKTVYVAKPNDSISCD